MLDDVRENVHKTTCQSQGSPKETSLAAALSWCIPFIHETSVGGGQENTFYCYKEVVGKRYIP